MKSYQSKLLLAIIILTSCQLFGQGSIKGTVVDSISKKPLPFATISIFKLPDTALITYRMSDAKGEFRVPNIPLNLPGYMLISYTGFDVYRKSFTLSNNSQLALDTVRLTPNAKSLDEVLVVAERPPVRVFNDTIEFNA